MDFQVRKGLETPLKVHGMRTKFFCIYCIILAVIVLFVEKQKIVNKVAEIKHLKK